MWESAERFEKKPPKARAIFCSGFFILSALLCSASLTFPATNHIVISEVQLAGTGGSTDEFVELHNPTCYAIDLSALPLKMHIRNSAGTDNNKTLTFISTTIPAHGYFLIAASTTYTGSASPDATYSAASGNTLVSNGSVYLSTTATVFSGSPGPGSLAIDMVGFGSQPSGGFETQTTSNPASGQSAVRRPDDSNGNGDDTNNNSADVLIRSTPTPENTASAARPPLPENLPPSSQVTSPTGTVSGVVTLAAQAWDNGECGRVVRVEFYYSTNSNTGPWIFISSDTHNTDTPSTSTYSVQWRTPTGKFPNVWARSLAVDHQGLTGDSVSSAFGIDNSLMVVINEISWMGTSANTAHEWIELKNNLNQTVNLSNWVLKSTDGTPSITLSGSIPPLGYYLLERTTDATVSDIAADLIYTGALQDTGEHLQLLDDKGVIVDSAPWDNGWPAGTASPDFKSMERKAALAGGYISSNWASNDGVIRNGNDANGNPLNGTPKSQNSAQQPASFGARDIVLNEIAWGGTAANTTHEWIELLSNATFSINMANWALEIVGKTTINLTGSMAPGGFYLIERSTDDVVKNIPANLVASFGTGLGNAGETLNLKDPSGVLIDSAPFPSGWPAGTGSPDFKSMERKLPTASGSLSTNWGANDTFTRNGTDANNNPLNATAKAQNSLFDTQAPSQVTTLLASPGALQGEIRLSWLAPGDDGTVGKAASYDIRRTTATPIEGGLSEAQFAAATPLSGIPLPLPFGSTQSMTITGLTLSTNYYFAMKSKDDVDHLSVLSNTSGSLPFDPPPSAPSNFKAKLRSDLKVSLSWNANAEPDLAGYNVYRSTASGSGRVKLNASLLIGTTFTDTAPSSNTTFFYSVSATDTGNNESSFSEISKFVFSALSPDGNILINEVMYDPSTTEPGTEWVEMANINAQMVDLGLVQFTDSEGTYTIPEETFIPGTTLWVLAHTTTTAGGSANTKHNLVYGSQSFGEISLLNTGDEVIFKNESGGIIDQLIYSSSWGATGSSNFSLQRKSTGAITQDITNWGESLDAGGTPQGPTNTDIIPPAITHTPITITILGRDIGIHATITDNIAPLLFGDAKIFYRRTESSYAEVTMGRVSDTIFDGIIPGSSVTSQGIDYFIRATDKHNNFSTIGSASSPNPVQVVPNPHTLVVNEFMYDPPQTEPDFEWVELHNYGTLSIDLSGFQLTDMEGTYTIPSGKTIPAGGFFVLARTTQAANGNFDVLYGTVPSNIRLTNTLATFSDQVIIKDPTDLVIDEVNYSGNWGAQNVQGPNNHTLERLISTGPSNAQSNWLYSMVQGGTPKAKNSSHLVRNVKANPTAINPAAGETSTIEYDIVASATVDIKIYNSSHTLVRTLQSPTSQAAGHYTKIWDGKDDAGNIVSDVCTFEVHGVTGGETGEDSLSSANDAFVELTQITLKTDAFITGGVGVASFGYNVSKPSRMTLDIFDTKTEVKLRRLLVGIPRGSGNNMEHWDGRDDAGIPTKPRTILSNVLSADDIFGNVIISLAPLKIRDLQTAPRSSIDPLVGETQTVSYNLSVSATVLFEVFQATSGVKVRTLVNNENKPAGANSASWDGKDDAGAVVGDGRYIFRLTATASNRKAVASGELTVIKF